MTIQVTITTEAVALVSIALLGWVAFVHFLMAFGVRHGEIVWTGDLRVLPPGLRRRSLGYAILLVLSGWLLASYGGLIDFAPVRSDWLRSAGWSVMVFLGVAGLYSMWKGSTWERRLFGPILLFGAGLAAWLTFA